jgi:hypothetical protein
MQGFISYEVEGTWIDSSSFLEAAQSSPNQAKRAHCPTSQPAQWTACKADPLGTLKVSLAKAWELIFKRENGKFWELDSSP